MMKIALALVLLLGAACSQEPAPTRPKGGVSSEVLAKVCHAEHADESSTVFSALGPSGDVERLVVTPSRKIADMGNLVFDMNGVFLGHDTGSEVPWDDPAFMAKERERVAALLGRAEIPNQSEPIRCDAAGKSGG